MFLKSAQENVMIAASIVTYKTSTDELADCLRCLAACDTIARVDVVDNASQQSLKDFLALNFPDVNYIPNVNNGYGAGNNISIRRSLRDSKLKYHIVLNSDILFEPSAVDTLQQKLDIDSSIGLIMPAVIGRDGLPLTSCHPLPSPVDLLLHRFTSDNILKRWREKYDLCAQNFTHDIDVPYMCGSFLFFRLDALRHVGLFDERFFMYPEDIDITRRVHRQYKTIVTPDAVITHYHRAESRHNMRMLRVHAWNMLKYFAKWGFVFDRERRVFNRRLRDDLRKS